MTQADDIFARTTVVKWKSPAEEIIGAARVADKLMERTHVAIDHLCVAVPNRNWAAQAQRGFTHEGVTTTMCMPAGRLSADEQAALAALDALSRPEDPTVGRDRWRAAGRDAAELDELVATYGQSRGRTLMRVLGMPKLPSFSHALLHARGDETPEALAALLRGQLAHPTMPRGAVQLPIVDYRAVPRDHFEYLFLIGCVDGLIPGPAALEGDDDARARATDAARAGFRLCCTASRKRTIVSYFTSLDQRIADAAHIPYARCRRTHDATLAITKPTKFLNEAGAARPTTLGGQTFLREFWAN